jgi:hemolysin activation/secretion protein
VPNQPSTKRLCCIQKLGAALLCLCALPAAGAEGPQLGQEALRLQQQQQRDLQQLQLEQRQRQLQRGSFGAQPATPTVPEGGGHDERCWLLSGTRVAGVTLFSNAELSTHIKPYVAACMGVTQINRLLAEITRLYVEAGYIASRPYLISTPAAGHPLDIHVEEGYVEAIELTDQSLPVSLRGAFPGMLGKPLNLRDLEQGLDQLNRLRSVDLTADIAPGSKPGASRIILHFAQHGPSRWGLGLGVDNLGSAGTGRDRNAISLSLDSPLELNDSLNLSFSDTLNHGPRYSRSNSLFYSIPYGYWTYSLFASHARNTARPFTLSSATFYNSGRTDRCAR